MAGIVVSRRYRWAGYLLGFSLSGFFDGILLHQILQWHHLLSAVGTGDIRFQVAADGYFHALMYAIAAAGLWLLWRSRNDPGRKTGRSLAAAMLVGFGVWHVLDAVLSHWILGIHRIRMDSPHPLFWDLLWFGLFGLVPLILGWLLREGPDEDGTAGRRSSFVVRSLAALLVAGAGAVALRPPQDGAFTTVLFAPGTGQERVLRAVASVDGEMLWTDPTGELVVIRSARAGAGFALLRQGAVLVSGLGLPPGCFSFLKV